MTDAALTPRDEDNLSAAEYVLGLGDPESLTLAHTRARHDAEFAQRVASWQERFVSMTDSIEPVAPGKKLKKKILKQVFPKVRTPLLQRLWIWQGITLAALVLAAYLAAPLLRPTPEMPRDVFASHLTGDVDDLQVLAVVDNAGGLAMRRIAGGAPEGRALEVWVILPDRDPVSVGIWPKGQVAARMQLPPDLAGQVAQMSLAITDEPPGGAPEGAPTGTIRAVGSISEL